MCFLDWLTVANDHTGTPAQTQTNNQNNLINNLINNQNNLIKLMSTSLCAPFLCAHGLLSVRIRRLVGWGSRRGTVELT